MYDQMISGLRELTDRGGPVMWVLLALSVAAATLIFERVWYWVKLNHPGRVARVTQMTRLLRSGDLAGARALAEADGSVYARVACKLMEEPATEALEAEIIETERPRLERYMFFFNTLITGAPLLGLVGSVMGLITTFHALSAHDGGDPRSVGVGLAEALYATAGGLVIALMVLFPYNAFRVQIDRTLGRIDLLIAAARSRPAPAGAAQVFPSSATGQRVE